MLKRILVAASAAALALTLTGCEPGQFEKGFDGPLLHTVRGMGYVLEQRLPA